MSSTASDSELDTDVDDVSEVSEEDIDQFVERPRPPPPPPGPLAVVPEPADDFENDPWNAVGVFGLKVYYKIPEKKWKGKDGDGDGDTVSNEVKGDDSKENREAEMVRLRVERPNPYLWEDSSDDEADDESEDKKTPKTVEKEESKVLDVDDSAKDLVGEQRAVPLAVAVAVAVEGHVGGEDGKAGKEEGQEGDDDGEIVEEKED